MTRPGQARQACRIRGPRASRGHATVTGPPDASAPGKYPGSAGDPFTHGSRLAIMSFVRTTESKAAAAARIGPGWSAGNGLSW
jgi:hypothetical protein